MVTGKPFIHIHSYVHVIPRGCSCTYIVPYQLALTNKNEPLPTPQEHQRHHSDTTIFHVESNI